MLVAALMGALLISGASPEAEAYAAQAQEWLLAGQQLPRGFHHELGMFTPTDRYALVIWLRRAGLLTGPEIPVDVMVAPPARPDAVP